MSTAVELVSTGAELLSGRTVNRHACTLGDALVPLGFRLVRDTTVPDEVDLIAEAVRGALARVDVVVVSGGLGPTTDDITRDAVAKVLGRGIAIDPAARAHMAERYERVGRQVTPMAERQVLVVEGADVLLNPVGLAPGERLEAPDEKTIFVLPGPPREFTAVLKMHVLPWLCERRTEEGLMLERVLMVGGTPEAEVARQVEALKLDASIEIGYCAAPARVDLRLIGADAALLEDGVTRLREALGENVFAESRMSMQEAVIRGLADHDMSLATVEVASGGQLSHFLSCVEGGRGVYRGGLVTHRNDVLNDLCGVPTDLVRDEGAVSEAVARRMAAGVRDRLNADVGLSVTDVSLGHDAKPDGWVCIGVDTEEESIAFGHRFTGASDWLADWITQTALDRLRRVLRFPPAVSKVLDP